MLNFADEELPTLARYMRDSHYKDVAKFISKLIKIDEKEDLKDIPYEFLYRFIMIGLSSGPYNINKFGNYIFNQVPEEIKEKYEPYSQEFGDNIVVKKEDQSQEKPKSYESMEEYINYRLARRQKVNPSTSPQIDAVEQAAKKSKERE